MRLKCRAFAVSFLIDAAFLSAARTSANIEEVFFAAVRESRFPNWRKLELLAQQKARLRWFDIVEKRKLSKQMKTVDYEVRSREIRRRISRMQQVWLPPH